MATPVNQESGNYTSDITITVNTSNNASIVRCGLAGVSTVGMTTLRVGGN